jgi:hypothetical protein
MGSRSMQRASGISGKTDGRTSFPLPVRGRPTAARRTAPVTGLHEKSQQLVKKRPQAFNAVNAEGAAELAYTPGAKSRTTATSMMLTRLALSIKQCRPYGHTSSPARRAGITVFCRSDRSLAAFRRRKATLSRVLPDRPLLERLSAARLVAFKR